MRNALIWKEIPGGRCISLFLKEKTVWSIVCVKNNTEPSKK